MKNFLKIFLLLPTLLFAQKSIYRSVQYNQTAVVWTDGGTRTFTISNDTIYFSASAPDTMGLGDVVSCDTTILNLVRNITLFITKRINNTTFIVKRNNGSTPPTLTTRTLWDVDRAYTTMANIPTGIENTGIGLTFDGSSRNLVTNNETYIVVCYNGADSIVSAGMNWGSNFVTGASNRLKIITPVTSDEVGKSQRHSGKYSGYGYKIFRNASGAGSLITFSNGTSEAEHVEIDGIACKVTGTGGQVAFQVNDLPADGIIIVSNCVMAGSDSTSTQTGTVAAIYGFGAASGAVIKVSNTIIYGWKTAASTTNEGGVFTGSTFSGTITCNNVTGYKNEVTYARGAGTMNTNNCIANRTANGWSGTIGGNYNISDLSSDAPGANSKNSTTVSFSSISASNFLLSANDTAAKNAGTDLSGGDPAVTKGIRGNSRPQGTAFDIGADELDILSTHRRSIIIQ